MEVWGDARYLTPLSLSENGEQLSQSDSSESVINSARGNVNSTINPDVGLEIRNDTVTGGGEKSNYMKRSRKRITDSLTMEAVEKYTGTPIDEAAMRLAVSRSTLKRFCRDHGMLSWPFPKHKKRTVDVADSKLSRKSMSRQNLQLYLDTPFGLFEVVLLLVRVKRWRKRNVIQYAMQNNNLLEMYVQQDNNKASKKRKRIDLPVSLEEIREHCGKTMVKVMNNLGVGTGKLRCIWQWWSYTKRPKLIQAPVVISTSVEAPTSVVAASNEPVVTTNITHDRATLVFHQQEQTNLPDELAQSKKSMREQFIKIATASAVKKLTIKATYKENMVKFPFTIIDGLEKLKEMVATRFQLKLGSFKLKYVDEDDDMILIACDIDLMLLTGDPRQPINQPVTRLLVLPIVHA